MEKKEAKSKWYYNKKGSEKIKSSESKQKGKRKSFDIAKMLKNASEISDHTLTSMSDSNESIDTLIVSSDEIGDEIEAAANIPRLMHTAPTSIVSQRLIFEKSQPSVDETGNQSPDLFSRQQEGTGSQSPEIFSQQEETGNQSPDMFSQQEETGNQSPEIFSQQEETGNQSPEMFSQQEETGNQSPDMLSQQEETGNQSPDMLSQQVKNNECHDIQKQMETKDGDFA